MDLGRTDFHVRRVARAREREETPNWSPQNMWCFSVVFRVATCEFEIAKTGRRSISKISPRSSDPQPWKSSQPRFCAKHRCIRTSQKCHAQVWPMLGRGVIRESEDAKTALCTIWRYGFARSWRDLTICVAKGGACSSGFLFRKAASQLRRPGSAI